MVDTKSGRDDWVERCRFLVAIFEWKELMISVNLGGEARLVVSHQGHLAHHLVVEKATSQRFIHKEGNVGLFIIIVRLRVNGTQVVHVGTREVEGRVVLMNAVLKVH